MPLAHRGRLVGVWVEEHRIVRSRVATELRTERLTLRLERFADFPAQFGLCVPGQGRGTARAAGALDEAGVSLTLQDHSGVLFPELLLPGQLAPLQTRSLLGGAALAGRALLRHGRVLPFLALRGVHWAPVSIILVHGAARELPRGCRRSF